MEENSAGLARIDRAVLLGQFAVKIGEDRWPAGEACLILRAAVGREPSDTTAVRGDDGRIAALPVATW